MSGFLNRMAARAHGVPDTGTSAVHLRPRARFEPVPDRPPAGAASIPRQSPLPDQRTAGAPAAATTVRRRPRSVPVPTATEPDGAPQPDPTPSVGAGPQVQRKTGHSGPDGGPPVPLAAPPDTEQAVVGAATPLPDRPRPSPAVVPDPLVLVRERVVPVLVEAGVLGATEDVEVIDAAEPPAGPQKRRAVRLRVDTPRPTHLHRAGPEPRNNRVPDIHVHIGRIEVTRPAAPPPPPARPTAPAVDHAAYLARRRELR